MHVCMCDFAVTSVYSSVTANKVSQTHKDSTEIKFQCG